MSRPAHAQRVSAAALVRLRRSLSERDLAVLASVAECRFLTARQLQRWHFPVGEDGHTAGSADRVARRVLSRHVRDRLLVRLERRIGGLRAGSAGYIYALGPVGHRVLERSEPRRRFEEPSTRFLEHTLTIADVVVGLIEADRLGETELLECETEPHCWRPLGSGSRERLKPDLRLTLGAGDEELHWFVEVDLGTVHRPTVLKQCVAYATYYRTGREQHQVGTFPKVAWLTTPERVETLRRSIERDARLPSQLFAVTALADWRSLLLGAGSAR